MSLEKTTELYASVLHQLLPEGVHDSAQQTLVADDIYAHAKILAQSDIDAHRLLKVLEEVPLELLPDYEQEYGLPMLCAVPGSFSIEERLNALKLVRTRRNVFNRTYLEQILAVFGVTLIDVVKFKPMQCTAPCNAPVNTERLRYKVFLRLQYPVNADMNCIIENYLPGYLRIDWVVDMPWGIWILNTDVTVNTNGIAHYTAYKTNQRDYYDSYADLDLTAAIVRSLHDTDMQQWQAVKDALQILTSTSTYSFKDGYIEYESIDVNSGPYSQIIDNKKGHEYMGKNMQDACSLHAEKYGYIFNYVATYNSRDYVCQMANVRLPVTYYKKDYTYILKTIQFTELAQRIISNLQSSNEGTSLLAEAYVETVAKSIFAIDESKQFVKLSDLIAQFEANKTLRI